MCEDREIRGDWGFIAKRSVLLCRSRTREQSKERSGERMETGREIEERHFWGAVFNDEKRFCAEIVVTNLICLFFCYFCSIRPAPNR